jgi:hypothetical protein
MRPCNLCRQPVENRRLICEECERRNEDAGNPYKASVGLRVDESQMPNDEPVIDHSFNILMLAFDGVIAALGAMLGLATYGWTGFLIGGAIGSAVGVFLFFSMTR